MRCQKCGNDIPENSKFCNSCGSEQTSIEQKPKKKSILMLLLLATIIVLLVIFFLPCSHDWIDATCTTPKTCEKCGETEGDVLDHIKGEWVVTQKATLISNGAEKLHCSVCEELLDKRDIKRKQPNVDGESFNFNDKEFIDWVNYYSSAHVNDTDLKLFEGVEASTEYYIDFSDGESGVFILNHDENDNIRVIAVWSDDESSAVAMPVFLGEKINSDFSTDDALLALYAGQTYSKAKMTVMKGELADGFEVVLLAPTAWVVS